MGVVRASIPVIGAGLALGWGLVRLRSRLSRGQPERSAAQQPAAEAHPMSTVGATSPASLGAERGAGDDAGALRPAPVRVEAGGHAGWARRRQEQVKAAIGEETYRTLEALMRWCWGVEVEQVIADLPVARSGFYYRLEQALMRLPQVFADGRQHNGRKAAGMERTIAGRIVELVVGQSGSTPAEISRRLAEQDGTRVSPDAVGEYLAQAQLADYGGSPYRPAALPVVKVPDTRFSRYTAHLLQVPLLEQLGFYQVAPLLDVTGPRTHYSHLVRCHTVWLALSSGKTRLYHTGELVEDEFARVLAETRYPQSSDLHAYFDRMVVQDWAQAQQGVAEAERLVERFVCQAQQALARAAPPGAGRAIYVDPHVIALYTGHPIARTRHGTQQRVVKALVKLRVVSANQPGRPLVFQLGQGDLSFHAALEAAVDLTTWTTGETVTLVGVDRGALSQAVLERFTARDIGLTVWSEDTPAMRGALAAVERSAFQDAEYETVRRADGRQVSRLKTRVADVLDMVINGQGYHCRTIVVEDVPSGHRSGIHAVGQPTHPMSARQILAFMRGKQWAEEEIKQGIAWGSDAFCGGKIVPTLRRERPDAEELAALKIRARQLKARWRANLAEEATAVAEWRSGHRTKRQLNDVLKGIRRRRKRIEGEWQQAEELIAWGCTGRVPDSQVKWVVDTRKPVLSLSKGCGS